MKIHHRYDKEKYNVNLFLISDSAHPLADPDDKFRDVKWGEVASLFDAIMPVAGLYDGFLWYRGYFKGVPVENPIDNQKWLEYKKREKEKWSSFCKDKGII